MLSNRRESTVSGPVERAFLVLQTVAASADPVGVRELGRRTGLARSTAARLAAQLVGLGMLTRTTGGGLDVGPGVVSLQPRGRPPAASLQDRLRPLLFDMVERFGESAALTIDTASGAHYLAQLPAPGAVQVPDATGTSFPFHVVASGLALMAAWPSARLSSYLARPLAAPTERSVVSPDAVRHRIADFRKTGSIWTDQELDLEVNGLAVAIRNAKGTVIAAMSLYGPSYRFNPTARPQLGHELHALVEERSSRLAL